MEKAASAGLRDETSHDERDIISVGNVDSRLRPIQTEVAYEAPNRKSSYLEIERDEVHVLYVGYNVKYRPYQDKTLQCKFQPVRKA